MIAGQGSCRDALERRVREIAADVQFIGVIEGDALDRTYRGASVVVLASHREGLPNVVLEGMAYGRPVVATPVGGVRDLITDGVNGLLVPAGNPVALMAAIERLRNDPELARRIGLAARATANRFAWKRMQTALEALLEQWRHA